jgi:hypothetical protein
LLGAHKRQRDAHAPKDRVVKAAGSQNDFTPSEVNLMAFAVREGRANPDDARALLTLFCQCVEYRLILARNPVADRLLEHVREAFRAYLKGGRVGWRNGGCKREGKAGTMSIKAALGLVRKKGRPEADEQRRIQMAASVLRRRLTGMSHQPAVSEAADEFHCDESVIGEAWRAHRVGAAILVRLMRGPGGSPWTDVEAPRLRKALGKTNADFLGEIRGFNPSDPSG